VYNVAGAAMTKEIEAVYEQGMIRPLQPLELPEGARIDLIVITHEQPKTNGNAAKILAEIAALPLEGSSDAFAGREHDSILYPKK
jgi:predicted DNA-binding antitoxin AbrB/MazE fold protein